MKKGKKTPTSAVESLNDDLVEFCILPRLPVSSLMRFKCVSKKWHHLISNPNPHFIRMQLYYASSGVILYSEILNTCNYICKDPGNLYIPNSDDHINLIDSWFMASCNGLVCFINLRFRKLFIGNPFLNDWKQLPYCRGVPEKFWGLAVYVGKTSHQYKLVVSRELWIDGHREHEFHVFSSTSEQWKVVENRIALVALWSDIGVYVMGSIYWRFRSHNDIVVLRFSLEDEECSLLSLPPVAQDGRIGECGGKLCYTSFTKGEIEMWSLDQSQWSKRLSINFGNCIQRKLKSLAPASHKMQLRQKKPYSTAYQVIMLPFEGRDVFAFSVDGTLYFYDIQAGQIRERLYYRGPFAVFPYRNTILPLP